MNESRYIPPLVAEVASFWPGRPNSAEIGYGKISFAARLIALASACLLIVGCGEVISPEGPRAEQMDRRYVDFDDDLVADTPRNPNDWADPGTLVFAYTPVEDPFVYEQAWRELLDHLAKVTGRKIQFFPVQSNAAQLESMRAGRLHVTGFNTGSVPIAVNLCGFVPFCTMASDDDQFGYRMQIIVPVDSKIQQPQDLRGHRFTFTSPTSNSGCNVPTVVLRDEFGMVKDRDYEATFSGKHDNSIMGIANGDYEAAAVSEGVLNRMQLRGAVDLAKIRVIYQTDPFPATAYGYAHNLHPELAKKIRQAFFTFDWKGSGLEREFGHEPPPKTKFLPITYKKHWAGVRHTDEALGTKYAVGH